MTLSHFGGENGCSNHWLVKQGNSIVVDGHLTNGGYRSAQLLVLVFSCNNNRHIRRVAIWGDSVTAHQYSYLNLQMMFNTSRR